MAASRFGYQCGSKHDPDPKGRVSAKCAAVFRRDHAQARPKARYVIALGGATLAYHPACLASPGDFVITAGKSCGAAVPDIPVQAITSSREGPMSNVRILATDLEFPEGPVVMPDGSVVLVEIRGQRLTRNLSRRPQGGRRQVPGGPNGAALGPDGKMYICNNGGFSWIPTGKMIMPGPQPRRTISAARSSASICKPARSRPSSPNAASMRCAGRTTSCSTSMAACGSPISASAAPARWMSAASITSSPA